MLENRHQEPGKALVIADIEIFQDEHGRYNLNALHRASEMAGENAKSPGQWLKRQSAKALISELQNGVSFSTLEVVHGGERSGTYAHELLAISYAGWISPAFQLKVNQAFIDVKTGRYEVIPPLPAPMSISDRIAAINALLEIGEKFRLNDDYTRINAREVMQNVLRELGNPYEQKQLPAPSGASKYFTMEDLRPEFPDLTNKQWMTHRGTFGKVCRTSIQAADPDCQPEKTTKFVNGAEHPVNMWPNAYKGIAIAAIQSYLKKVMGEQA